MPGPLEKNAKEGAVVNGRTLGEVNARIFTGELASPRNLPLMFFGFLAGQAFMNLITGLPMEDSQKIIGLIAFIISVAHTAHGGHRYGVASFAARNLFFVAGFVAGGAVTGFSAINNYQRSCEEQATNNIPKMGGNGGL